MSSIGEGGVPQTSAEIFPDSLSLSWRCRVKPFVFLRKVIQWLEISPKSESLLITEDKELNESISSLTRRRDLDANALLIRIYDRKFDVVWHVEEPPVDSITGIVGPNERILMNAKPILKFHLETSAVPTVGLIAKAIELAETVNHHDLR